MNYKDFLKNNGMTENKVVQFMSILPEPELPAEGDHVYPIFSKIQGIGLASKLAFNEGDTVLTLLDNTKRQVGARYLNHTHKPNTKAVISEKNLLAIATRPISVGEEITICYNENVVASREYTKIFLNKQNKD